MRVAFVAAVGGAGATRLSLECAAMLARDGRSAAILDASFATQGLADHLHGRIDPDVTALLTGGDSLDAGLVDIPLDPADRDGGPVGTDGPRLAVCPARAPFERIARAKATDAARRFEELAAEAGHEFEHLLFDVPPVAANQAVAAVSAADVVAVVVPATARGSGALARTRDRLTDVGAPADATIANFDDDAREERIDADAAVPVSSTEAPANCPVAGVEEGPFPAAIADATETLFDVVLDVSVDADGFL